MAAYQLNKRSKVSNAIRHTSWEQQKAQKNKLSHYDSNMRSSISLEWDNKKENVVPKKDQLSISRRELAPFLPLVSHCRNVLGDVFVAPPELFELENLIDLLSYEVWQTHLSVQEREFLIQFLPEGVEPHKVVHELLAGNNLYFGNPFSKWGASICSGDCHPDAVLRQEQRNKANTIAYYSELHQYHTKMIGSLQLWKERWASCVNPEEDFMQKILKSRKDFHNSGSSQVNGTLCGPEDNFATSDSCSWDADDKSYSSDSPKLTMMHGETSRRVSRMDSEDKYDSSGGWRSVARPRKGDELYKRNIECGDGAKYMSYIKVSKKHHERVKSSMKYYTSIQPRSLNHVLGNLGSFCVQPYEMFEEEERQRLHEHWSNLAKKHLPAGFENWKSWQSAKWQLTKSLRRELEDRQKSNDLPVSDMYNQGENGKSHTLLLHGTYSATLGSGLMDTTKDEEKEPSLCRLYHDQQTDGETSDELLIAPEDNEEHNADSIFHSEAETHETAMQIKHTNEPTQVFVQNQDLHQISIPNGTRNLCPISIASGNNALTETDTFQYNGHMHHTEAPISEIWPAASLPSAYYHEPTSVHTSIRELSLGHPHVSQDQSSHVILDSDIHQKDPLRGFLQRRSDGGDSFFNPYSNQDRNELLLHSLFKDPTSSHYLNEQKQSRLGFHPLVSDPMFGSAQFHRNSLPLDLRLKRLGDVYMHHNVQENMYAQQVLPHQNWHTNGVLNSMPMAAGPSQNWLSGEEMVVRDGWSGGLETGNNGGLVQVADESLFSVLSQCKGLHSSVHFGSTGVTVQPGSYGGAVPMGGNCVPPPPRMDRGVGLSYMSGNEGWINFPRENER